MATTAGATTLIAASYERVSRLTQAQYGYSLKDQRRRTAAFAAARGWTLPDQLRFRDGDERDASGRDWDLPGLTAMLTAAREGEFNVLIVPHTSRFARDKTKARILKDMLRKKFGVQVVYENLPHLEDSPEGRLQENILEDFDEYHLEVIRANTMLGAQQKARDGEVVGSGRQPYGYRYTFREKRGHMVRCGLEPDPLTVHVARRIFERLLTRSSIEVADELNAEGIPGPRGGRWYTGTLTTMARNPVYIGAWKYSDIDVAVPPLVDRSRWERVQDALDQRHSVRRGRAPRDQDAYLLRGMLVCGHCQRVLRTSLNSGIRYYRCSCRYPSEAKLWGRQPCDLPDVHACDIEAELWARLTEAIQERSTLRAGLDAARASYHDADRLRRDRLEIIASETTRQRRRLDELAGKIVDADGEVYAALMRQANDIDAMLKRYVREQAELERVRPDGLSEEDVAAIEEFARRYAISMAEAEPAERRELVELLRVRGTVYADPEGVRLGRKHCFRVDWNGLIPLPDSALSLSEKE